MQATKANEFSNKVSNMFLTYATYVNSKLPSLDSLKTVQRRIMYVMKFYDDFTKSARVVGDIIGKYHPHGDVGAYSSLVNLVNKGLVRGKGNFGSGGRTLEPIEAAAYRYTEVKRMSGHPIIDDMYELMPHALYVTNQLGNKEPLLVPSLFPLMLLYMKKLSKGDSTIGVTVTNKLYQYTYESLCSLCAQIMELNMELFDGVHSYNDIVAFIMHNTVNTNGGGSVSADKSTFKRPKKTKLLLKISEYDTNDCWIDPNSSQQSFQIKVPYNVVANDTTAQQHIVLDFHLPSSKIKKFISQNASMIRVVDNTKDDTSILVTMPKAFYDANQNALDELCIYRDTIQNTVSIPTADVFTDNVPLNYLTMTIDTTVILAANLMYYTLVHRNKIEKFISNTENSIKEKQVVAVIRERLKQKSNWDIDPKTFAKEVVGTYPDLNLENGQVVDILNKYPVRSLLTISTDIKNDIQVLEKYKKNLKELVATIYNKFKSN